MEGSSKSNAINDDDAADGDFSDAPDEFPFSDASPNLDSDSSEPPPIEAETDLSTIESKQPPESTSPTGLRRRRYSSQQVRRDVRRTNSTSDSAVSVDLRDVSSAFDSQKKYKFPPNLSDNEKRREKLGEMKYKFSSNLKSDEKESEKLGTVAKRLKEQSTSANSTITTVNDDDERNVEVDLDTATSPPDSSNNLLFLLAGLVIKAIGFQMNLLVSFLTFPIWFMYNSYMFVIDPFGITRWGRAFLLQKGFKIGGFFYNGIKLWIYGWFQRNESTWKLALRLAWGFLWAAYVCFILVSLFVSAFVISGIIMKNTLDEPIRMKEELNFDYAQGSPVAFVPIMSCPGLSCVDCNENPEHWNTGESRVIPSGHKLQATVSLTLPESDYNRNLGMFQLRVDFLSASGKAIASLRQPCMLQFKSQPIRLVSTFFKLAPLITGYSSESQTLNIKFRGYTEKDVHTSCLRVVMEQRAEFSAVAGVPEIYSASLNLESELPLLKRILWSWKGTIFVWTSIMMFTLELLFALICCTPIFFPKTWRRSSPHNNDASQTVQQTQS